MNLGTPLNQIITWTPNQTGGYLKLTPTIIDAYGNISGIESLKIISPDASNTTTICNPYNMPYPVTLTLPVDNGLGTNNQFLSNNGSGTLSWLTAFNDLTSPNDTINVGSDDNGNPTIDLPETGIVANTYSYPSSITFDSYGRAVSVISGTTPAPRGILVLAAGSSGTIGSTSLPSNVTAAKITVIGGGGAGGTTNTTLGIASGGGAGGTSISYVTDISAATTYSVGTQGVRSTFATNTVSLNGNAGSSGSQSSNSTAVNGGAGGTATGGQINIKGNAGLPASGTASFCSGAGGNSFLTAGGSSVISAGGGQAGLYGSGGSGGFKSASGTGGLGGAGLIIIEY
jgi:hypothetical protein